MTRRRIDYSANHEPIQEFELYLREQADLLRWPHTDIYQNHPPVDSSGPLELGLAAANTPRDRDGQATYNTHFEQRRSSTGTGR